MEHVHVLVPVKLRTWGILICNQCHNRKNIESCIIKNQKCINTWKSYRCEDFSENEKFDKVLDSILPDQKQGTNSDQKLIAQPLTRHLDHYDNRNDNIEDNISQIMVTKYYTKTWKNKKCYENCHEDGTISCNILGEAGEMVSCECKNGYYGMSCHHGWTT